MGGARPRADSIVLDLQGMARVRAVDRRACTATAQAGIVLEALDRRMRARGLALGHDPWSRPRATLGGAISTNGVGYGAFLRGSMGDQVLGLEAVLMDGTVIRTRPAVRATAGLDLRHLFIGTEGTLGVVTEATIRGFPIPEREEIKGFTFAAFERGLECLERMYDDGLVPSVMDLDETFPSRDAPWPSGPEPPTLFLGFTGSEPLVRGCWRLARRHLGAARARSLPDREARTYWRTRHDIIYRTDEVAPGESQADRFLKDVIFDYVHVALPRSQILAFRRRALAALRRHGVSPTSFGVWTQPELASLEMVRPVRDDRAVAKAAVAEAIDEALRAAHALGGSMEYVHGVGLKLAHLMGEELREGLDVYARVKRALDPNGLLNPGKSGL
jgi:FAD/FMN-containing dehydrogenase